MVRASLLHTAALGAFLAGLSAGAGRLGAATVSAPFDGADLRVVVERHGSEGAESVVVYGSGVGIWENRLQFRVDEVSLRRVREILETSGFREMPELYGDGKKWLVRRVGVRSGGYAKEVVQILEGEQSKELEGLVDRLFEVLAPLSRSGASASSLADGLAKVRAGELAPQALHFILHVKPAPGNDRDGFLAKIEGGRATYQAYQREAYEKAVPLRLDPDRLGKLTAALAAADLADLPGNLHAEDYTELIVEVLDHRKTILARRFAGLKPTAHGARQLRFESLLKELKPLLKPAKLGNVS